MCGIIAYCGEKNATPILINGLKQLEYRGYDSAGLAILHDNTINIHKAVGRVEQLSNTTLQGSAGIAHTRWATHGKPSQENAHPFVDGTKSFALVHNGIIENYLELKEELRAEGVLFSSQTDSEVIVHLIAKNYTGSLVETVRSILKKLQGTYAFCVMHKDKQEVVAARNGSPLIVGIGENENYLASDASALLNHTKKVIYVEDFDIVHITKKKVMIFNEKGEVVTREIKEIEWDIEQAQKQGFRHFMLKEIHEQPKIAQESLRVQIPLLEQPQKIIIVACGTAYYAGLIAKYFIEKVAKISTIVEVASEFRYKEFLLEKNDLVVVISQSGETADTLAAARLAKEHHIKTLGIINVVNSTIAREVDQVIYTRAGPEIGVASTKALTSQLIVLYKLAIVLAKKEKEYIPLLENLSEYMQKMLLSKQAIEKISQKYYKYAHFLYIGRNRNYPVALEGALKLKEISYIHAEGYPAGELKHGPIALVSEEIPTLAICPKDEVYAKMISNIEEIKARSGSVIAIATQGDEKISKICDDVIFIPEISEDLNPFICLIPLQLFAYFIAVMRECDVDKPRNLAKSVTVE